MTNELAGATDLPVQVIGLNRSVHGANAASLAGMTGGRMMPWLRCPPEEPANDPSVTWRVPISGGGDRAVINRELVIVDHTNRFLGSFDLTNGPIHDDSPGGADRRALVREFIRNAATIVDSDNDRLPDHWERDTFEGLAAEAATPMPTVGGRTAFDFYALGPWPPTFAFEEPPGGGAPVRTLRYRQRLGLAAGLGYAVAATGNLLDWLEVEPGDITVVPQRPIYDGSGTGEVVVRWLASAAPAAQLFRVSASAP